MGVSSMASPLWENRSLPGPRHSLSLWAAQVTSPFSSIYLLPTLAQMGASFLQIC